MKKKSLEESLSISLGRARIGCLLQPQELMTPVSPQSNFAKRPTMALRLSSAEFNEVDWKMQKFATGLLQFGDVLFALLVTGTQSYFHLGVMDMADPASYSAVLQCAKSGAVNIGVTNAGGEYRLSCLDVEDAFAVAIERATGMRKQVSRAQLLQAFSDFARDATKGSLIQDLGLTVRKGRAVAHLLLPRENDLFTATGDISGNAGRTMH
jgi:hypothetical protein